MSNRHAEELRQVYKHLFQDARYAFPTLKDDFSRDEERLESLANSRGIYVYVVDLPALGKHLDLCLSNGQYKLSGLPLSKRYSGRVVIPKFLRGLYLLVFCETGALRRDYSELAITFLRQFLYCAKKAAIDCDTSHVLNEVEEMHRVDSELPEVDDFWYLDEEGSQQVGNYYCGFHNSSVYCSRVTRLLESGEPGYEQLPVLLKNLDVVSRFLCSTLGSYDPSEWSFKHGPGAVSERKGVVNKYQFVNWSPALESVYPIADCGFHNYQSWADSVQREPEAIRSTDPSSRLVAVRKTFTKPRLIAAEPSEHQWCQQNIWQYISTRSSQTWISNFVRFRDQSLNQTLCLQASRTGHLATVDLSSASDRVSCHAVGNFFCANSRLLDALRASRTRYLSQDLNPKVPSLWRLRKFSTMGSACTFPVESLMFLGIALASVLTYRHMRVTPSSIASLSGEVAVFGDDCVIPVDCRDLFYKALEVIDFKVNTAKSYGIGKFRESCGVDAFNGCNVTPVYWRLPCTRSPESVASSVQVHNNFYQKWLLCTAAYLASTIRKNYDIPYVSAGSGASGLYSRCVPSLSSYRIRMNCDLQRQEVFVPQIVSVVKKTEHTSDAGLLQYFTEAPSPYTPWRNGIPERVRLKVKRDRKSVV